MKWWKSICQIALYTDTWCLATVVTNWEIVEPLLFVWKTRKFRKEFICNGSSRRKSFREKSNAFRAITFFPFLPKGPKFPVPFFLDYQCQAPSREKAKNLPVFCKWYNSIPFLFSVPQKNTSDIWRDECLLIFYLPTLIFCSFFHSLSESGRESGLPKKMGCHRPFKKVNCKRS